MNDTNHTPGKPGRKPGVSVSGPLSVGDAVDKIRKVIKRVEGEDAQKRVLSVVTTLTIEA